MGMETLSPSPSFCPPPRARRVPRMVVPDQPRSVARLVPSVLADERHEHTLSEVVGRHVAGRVLGRHLQHLHIRTAHRNYETPTRRELIYQRSGHHWCSRRYEDALIGRAGRIAVRAIAHVDVDRTITEPFQKTTRSL